MSTGVSIYAVWQIFATTKILSATNERFRIKSYTLEIHSALLVLSCFFAVCCAVSINTSRRIYAKIAIVLAIVDLLVQLLICYI